MRNTLQQHLAGKTLPLTLAHMGGIAHGPENKTETIVATLTYSPDIIELDIRKSKDGVLYCHHGSIPFGILFSQILHLFSFQTIQHLLGPVDTFEKILSVIPPNTIVYVDIKENVINARDLLPIFDMSATKRWWIAAYSVQHLHELRDGLGEKFVYVLNQPRFNLATTLRALDGKADIVQLFLWQATPRQITALRDQGVEFHISRFGALSQTTKQNRALQYKDVWLTYDDLTQTHKTTV